MLLEGKINKPNVIIRSIHLQLGGVAEWVRALAWHGDRTFPAGFEPHFGKNFSLGNFGNSVYPYLPLSFGGDSKSRRSLLSGVNARGRKR